MINDVALPLPPGWDELHSIPFVPHETEWPEIFLFRRCIVLVHDWTYMHVYVPSPRGVDAYTWQGNLTYPHVICVGDRVVTGDCCGRLFSVNLESGETATRQISECQVPKWNNGDHFIEFNGVRIDPYHLEALEVDDQALPILEYELPMLIGIEVPEIGPQPNLSLHDHLGRERQCRRITLRNQHGTVLIIVDSTEKVYSVYARQIRAQGVLEEEAVPEYWLPNTPHQLMFKVPESISQQLANQVQAHVRNLASEHCNHDLDRYYTDVVGSYATGSRHGVDGEGAGPGLLYVAALQHILHHEHVPCYSGLTLPIGRNWEVFKLRLAQRGEPRAKLLIVLLTEAFYSSNACLEEVSLADQFRIPVIPLVFERNLPKRRLQWPKALSEDEKLMVERAQHAISGRNTIPARGTFIDDPETNVT